MIRTMPCIAGCDGPMLMVMSPEGSVRTCSFVSLTMSLRNPRLAFVDGIVFAQRMPHKFFVHEDSLQVRMIAESDPEQIPNFSLQPVGDLPQYRHGIDFFPIIHLGFHTQPHISLERIQVINDFKPGSLSQVIDRS